MNDFIDEEIREESKTEFYLGTVKAWNSVDDPPGTLGMQIQLDGQDSPLTKRFKMLQTSRPLHVGTRVIVMKHSGTYVVIGEYSNPISYYHPSDLSSNASLADVITRCNLILNILRHVGIIWTNS